MLAFVSFALAADPSPAEHVVAIVPGCPTEEDGRLSGCQWRRVLWASDLYDRGEVHDIVVSGADAYTPYPEAVAMADALRRVGVPHEAVHEEPRALHTDQNVVYSLAVARSLGATTIVVASDAIQAGGACSMVRKWSEFACTTRAIDYRALSPRLLAGPPDWRVQPTQGWVPLDERERRMAAENGDRRRASSWLVYLGQLFTSRPPDLDASAQRSGDGSMLPNAAGAAAPESRAAPR